MSIDVEFGLVASPPVEVARPLRLAGQQEGSEVLRSVRPESSRRGLGLAALDSSGNQIPNSEHWLKGPSLADQFWPHAG